MNGSTTNAQADMKFFSSMADAYFKFESSTKMVLLTTGFTRIRLPFVVDSNSEPIMYMEKLVLMTSQDRTIVAAHSSRQVDESNMVGEFEHNTPLVLIISGGEDTALTLNIHSVGPRMDTHEIGYRRQDKKFVVPTALDVKSSKFVPKPFDAILPSKKPKQY